MTSLNELIGETIVICPVIPFRSDHRKDMIYRIKLVGVESGGIWFESELWTKKLMKRAHIRGPLPPDAKIPVWFLPFSQIVYLLVGTTQIDAESLGL